MPDENYHVATEYGSTDVKRESGGAFISNTYSNTKIKDSGISEDISALQSFLRRNFKINEYSQPYLDSMDTSYALYGLNGVKTQVLYFLSNARASTPAGKKYAKMAKKGGNPFMIT